MDRLEQDVPTLAPIQLIPPGLMGLLQLKQTGRLPGDLSGIVRGVIELRDWYMQARSQDIISFCGGQPRTALITSDTVGYAQFTANFTTAPVVPGNEWWWVTNMTVLVLGQVPSGDSVSFSLAWASPPVAGASGALYQLGTSIDNVADAHPRDMAIGNVSGFWLPPGAAPLVHTRQVTTVAGITYELQMRFTRLPA